MLPPTTPLLPPSSSTLLLPLRRKLGRIVLNRGLFVATAVFYILLLSSLIARVEAAQALAAEFTNSFDGFGNGGSVGLTWEGVKPEFFPLSITAQVIDKGEGEEGGRVTVYRVNVTAAATGSSYVWTNMPYPLRWIKTGLYQLELKPSTWTDGEAPVLARSPFFSVGEYVAPAPRPSESSSLQPGGVSQGDKEPSGGGGGVSKPVAIGVGVAIGVPSLVGLVVVGWFFRRKQQRAKAEKRRLKRSEFVIY
ncbi:hypothetical protein B0T21DRAFT_359267 [Apiosordaria backusii]|uniref:Uncharacterized protein n=1 Tax=Apiosordaria backusii TaxID=314023 RepID=A0AA40ETI1_9PEZI|nr:hypothetical protein B0T21DRAFT_359267 [Apiosordaria backusii]